MATQEPPVAPAPGPEINVANLGNRSGNRTQLPAATIAAINAEAAKTGGEPAPTPAPPVDPPKTPDAAPVASVKQPEPVKPAATPAQEPAKPKKEGIESVREALERQTQKAKELETSLTATTQQKADAFAKLAELEAKAAKYEQDIEKEYKPRVARLEQAEKKLLEREELLKVKAYQETEEFHNQFVKPLSDARTEVNELLTELIVQNEDGSSRIATQEDFNEILSAASINQAAEIAQKKFGPMVAQSVVNFRQRIRSLERNRVEAVKNAALRAEEYEKRTQAQYAQNRQELHDKLMAATRNLIASETDTFAVPEGDAELQAALTEGQQLADRLLNGDPSLSPDQYVAEIAKGRKNIMAAPLLTKKLAQANAKIMSLEEQLKAYQKSEPDVRTRNGGPAAPVGDSPRDKLLAAAQAAAQQV